MSIEKVIVNGAMHAADIIETPEGTFKCWGVDGEPWPVDEYGQPSAWSTKEEAVMRFLFAMNGGAQ